MQTSKYLVANAHDLRWGLTVNTVGYEEIEPDGAYPTRGHSDGYYFEVERGRILNEYQILYVTEGRGVFQSTHTPPTTVKTGDVFLLFPGEWHSYHPGRGMGWKCYWIGFKGANIDARVKAGFLSCSKTIYHIGYSGEVVRLYDSALQAAREEAASSQQLLAGIVNHLIGLVYALERNIVLGTNELYVEAINKARVIIRRHLENELTIQDVAREVGMGYSNFRKLFKEFTGISPALYQQDLRLQRAKELLSTTPMTIREIAYSLNFESADYFSAKFKKKTGLTPSEFRCQG